jgi:hypothetical protein
VQYELIKRRQTSELARALKQRQEVVSHGLNRLLKQHALEWSAFKDDLGKRSFVRKWIDNVS